MQSALLKEQQRHQMIQKITCYQSILDEGVEPTTVAVLRKTETADVEETIKPKTTKILLAQNSQ
eukprot:9261139-Ditylum_brightwellii.AAC.1